MSYFLFSYNRWLVSLYVTQAFQEQTFSSKFPGHITTVRKNKWTTKYTRDNCYCALTGGRIAPSEWPPENTKRMNLHTTIPNILSWESLKSSYRRENIFPLIFKMRENAYCTVVCLVVWPSNKSEAFIDLVSIETSLFFLCKFLLISMRTSLLT